MDADNYWEQRWLSWYSEYNSNRIDADNYWEQEWFSRYSDGLQAGWPEFDCHRGTGFFSSRSVQTHSATHAAEK
jgi:hypothetical protein